MLRTVILYFVSIVNPGMVEITPIENHRLQSTTPVIQCYGTFIESGEEYDNTNNMLYNCQTERLYYFMTGEDSVILYAEELNKA